MSVLDWGLAEKLDPPKRRFRGDGRGTDGFIAPEMESHKMCTSAIDIYSLGVTFESFAEWVPRRASVADWKAFDAMLDAMTDRKSVVSGKGVYVRVEIGGRGIIKTKNKR